MRVNEGRLYDDSLALAEAYVTTGKWRYIYPNDYARACYYYGYLLRQHGDQVAAMRAFINGSHAPYLHRLIPLPQFTDYHILGRIYSNMGTMCHLAGEFELGYDMYELSARSFYKADDTTAFYYALNAMALQLAEQNMHDETLSLLGKIEMECADANVLTKTWETKAILYKNLAQYDSAIYAAGQLYSNGYSAASGYVTMAQSYEHLGQLDSALFYAQRVLAMPNATSQEKYNMLYILTYNNTSISSDEIKQRAEERADIDKEILDPLHIQLAQAIDVLLQDKNRKPYYISIGILIFVICILGMTTRIAALRIKRHRKQSLETIEAKFSELQHDISEQREKLYEETRYEQQKQLCLQQQQQQLFAEHLAIIEQNCTVIRSSNNIPDALCWKDFDQMCRYINDAFFMFVTKLTVAGKFNEYEVRLCVLVLLDLDYETISHILKRAQNGIGKAKYRVAQKLGTTTGNLRQVLINLAIDAPTKDI
ncbi:MAG: hypothetical protein J6T76_00525 [Paludibacteraceae bacterium]|nr:hypothetical protein [Paludibacteraceae bacterium]